MARTRMPALPALLKRKLYKTGQTRGADDDEIYQNRVLRNSTVLIPYPQWERCSVPSPGERQYENGFIVLISPGTYFSTPKIDAELAAKGLRLGVNAVVFYETREQWNAHNPEKLGWKPAEKRTAPLGGTYVSRVPATTATNTKAVKINRGFTTQKPKGAGIRVYEYANSATIAACRLQLETLFWQCADADTVVVANGMKSEARDIRKAAILKECAEKDLLNTDRLKAARALNTRGVTICPLCLKFLSAEGFFTRVKQAEGREVPDLTVTQISLFHIKELRFGVLNHCPYNVAWGHHHCNVVVKDDGILETLKWLKKVVARNVTEGLFPG